jgi:uncharacterized membrane protein
LAVDVLILRLIHIGAGAFWVGAVFTNVLFLQPTAVALGPEGGRFSYHLARHRWFSRWVLIAAATTVLAGVVLLWTSTNGFDPELLFGPARVGFTVGGLIAILTFAFGALYVYPRTERVVRIMSDVMAAARAPAPEEQAQLARLRGELLRAGYVIVASITVATAAMATARYWSIVL